MQIAISDGNLVEHVPNELIVPKIKVSIKSRLTVAVTVTIATTTTTTRTVTAVMQYKESGSKTNSHCPIAVCAHKQNLYIDDKSLPEMHTPHTYAEHM